MRQVAELWTRSRHPSGPPGASIEPAYSLGETNGPTETVW
jgi:hypothetical protein